MPRSPGFPYRRLGLNTVLIAHNGALVIGLILLVGPFLWMLLGVLRGPRLAGIVDTRNVITAQADPREVEYLGALAAAVPGLVDLLSLRDKAIKKTGTFFDKMIKERKIVYMAPGPSASGATSGTSPK